MNKPTTPPQISSAQQIEFRSLVGDIVTDGFYTWLVNNGFFTAPAAAKHHGNTPGGLFAHSVSVTAHLVEMTERLNLQWVDRRRSPVIVGMFHDICKIDQYVSLGANQHGNETYEHNDSCDLTGHGEKSIIILQQHMNLTQEEIMCIRYHMGAFTDKAEWSYYSRACHNYPNVLWTHTADMLASQVEGV